MLTEAEKTHIELQEKYRAEVAGKFRPAAKINYIETVTKILQGLAIIIGIWATYNEFRKYNEEKKEAVEKEARQSARDFSRNFYQKQFDYYAEATEATATLSTAPKGSADYIAARDKFYRLFWGRLSLVEDACVEAKMVQFKDLLEYYEHDQHWSGTLSDKCSSKPITITSVDQHTLQQASLRLAHDARLYVLDTWLSEEERKKYNR